MTELEAARLVRAALDVLRDAIPEECRELRDMLAVAWVEANGRAHALERETPPWEPEPGPSAERKWSEVIPGDKVLAPNGTWYPVDSVARVGDKVAAMLVVVADEHGRQLVRTERRAGDVVKVERGDAGRAVDVFAAGGISLEQIGAGK